MLIAPLKELIEGLTCANRIPQIEVAAGDATQALIIRHLEPLRPADRVRIRTFEKLHGVRCYTQSAGPESVAAITGSDSTPCLSYANPDFGVEFRFHPMDFTQVNLSVNRALVRSAINAVQPAGRRVIDLFCGIGNFSLPLAASGARVLGFEGTPSAVERARDNAARNGLDGRCEFTVRDLYDPDSTVMGKGDVLLLDPPRSGAGPNLVSWVNSSEAHRVVYVSCSPASFAADAADLCRMGFRLVQVGVFDMFPHTAHVETLGVFESSW